MKRIRHFAFPFLLLFLTPPLVILMWYTNTALNGSVTQLFGMIHKYGSWQTVYMIWQPIFFGSPIAWTIIAIFAGLQLVLMRWLPGKNIAGPVTPKGNVPKYKENGIAAFIITLVLFYLATDFFQFFPATIIYDHFGEILSALNVFSLCFCVFLYFKGKYFPSSSDAGSSGNFLFDYFWGTELYPKICGWDVKKFTNCRFGMMGWSLIILSFAAKQHQLYGLSNGMIVSVGLQLLYIAKFFIWETGYMRSMDIMHDRAGFMICWGCLVWVPGIYTSPSLYLVHHPYSLGPISAFILFCVGVFCILINYLADRQRQHVRASQGQCRIWKKQPQLIAATYTTEQGVTKETLLLASGWWGIARHFHYIPEIAAALCWTLPALALNITPYFYVMFLTALLMDRAKRQERRCAAKYGNAWNTYCEKVPYRFIPFIF